MKNKRLLAASMAFILSAASLTGCSGGNNTTNGSSSGETASKETNAESAGTTEAEAPKGEKTVLTVWHTWGAGPGTDAMEKVVEMYNQSMIRMLRSTCSL